MAKGERRRDVLDGPLTLEYIQSRTSQGWAPVAVEWARGTDAAEPVVSLRGDVPFGLRISGDCAHLEENPGEMEVLFSLMELMIQDISLTRVAEELNRRKLPTREGKTWDAAGVFRLLPRLIDLAPEILATQQWEIRRKRLAPAAWNS